MSLDRLKYLIITFIFGLTSSAFATEILFIGEMHTANTKELYVQLLKDFNNLEEKQCLFIEDNNLNHFLKKYNGKPPQNIPYLNSAIIPETDRELRNAGQLFMSTDLPFKETVNTAYQNNWKVFAIDQARDNCPSIHTDFYAHNRCRNKGMKKEIENLMKDSCQTGIAILGFFHLSTIKSVPSVDSYFENLDTKKLLVLDKNAFQSQDEDTAFSFSDIDAFRDNDNNLIIDKILDIDNFGFWTKRSTLVDGYKAGMLENGKRKNRSIGRLSDFDSVVILPHDHESFHSSY